MSRVGIALAVTTPIPTDGEIVYSQVSSTTFIFSLCVYKGMGKYPSDTSYTSCISQCGVVLMCILLFTETLTIDPKSVGPTDLGYSCGTIVLYTSAYLT